MSKPVWAIFLANIMGPVGPSISDEQVDVAVLARLPQVLPDAIAPLLPPAVDGQMDARVAGLVDELNLVADYRAGSDQTWTDLDTVDPPQSAVIRALSTTLNRPYGSSAFMVWHMLATATSAVQIAVELGAAGTVWTRRKAEDVWSVWVQLVDVPMLDARTPVFDTRAEALAWEATHPGRTALTTQAPA